jgi:hypothetical protein
MPETAKTKKVRYQVLMHPELRYQLRLAAARRSISISSMLHDAVVIGLRVIEGKPPEKPAA